MGTRNSAKDFVADLKGRVEVGIGKATGNSRLAAHGRGEQAAVRMKRAADQALEGAKNSMSRLQDGRYAVSPTTSARRPNRRMPD